jgi:hypothetical protein
MDGSGRDGFVFLHGDVGKPKARIFRTNTTPWGAKSTAPWAHDPRLTIVAKCASLRRRPNTRGTKLVTPRQQRPYSAVRATSIFLWSIDQCPREKSYPDFKSNAFVVDVVGGLLVCQVSPRMRRRVLRQRKSSNRLSTPNKFKTVPKGMYRSQENKTQPLVPWLGNSKIKTRYGICVCRTCFFFHCEYDQLLTVVSMLLR